MSAWLPAAVMGIAVTLSGCTAGKSPPKMIDYADFPVPKKWSAKTLAQPEYTPDRCWISDFGDADLSAFVFQVLQNNRDIRSACARVQIAAAEARLAGADIYPDFELNFISNRYKRNFIGFPNFPGFPGGGVFSNHANQFGLSLDITWEIDIWGRVKAAQSRAIAEMEASQYDKALVELSIAAQAVKVWFALAESRMQVELAESALRTFRKTEEAVRDRFNRGIEGGNAGTFGSQVLLSQTDVATARDLVATRKELLGRLSRQLEVLAGKYPAGKEGQKARLPAFPSKRPSALPCTVLDRRPDLVAAERRLAAADQHLVEAKRTVFPTVELTTSGGTSAPMIEDILDGNLSIWSLAGRVTQSLLQHGRVKAGLHAVHSSRHLAAYEFEKAVLTAFAEVENALAAEQFFEERARALSEAADLAEQAFQQATEEYSTGTGDLLTVLTAQQRMFSQKSQLISLRRLRLEARVDLHLAIAGSFKPVPTIYTEARPVAL